VLLVHDLLLSKGGVAAPKGHSLRLIIERHKARLSAEFTRSRICQGFGSIEALGDHINGQTRDTSDSDQTRTNSTFRHPRWVRINTLRSTLYEQLDTTFGAYRQTKQLKDVLNGSPLEKLLYIDQNIPDLIALPCGHDLSRTKAYLEGEIIFQDKASCFPAYLLNPSTCQGDIIDTCAAPGNKTTHLAALAHATTLSGHAARKVFAFERDGPRSMILRKMVNRACGDKMITVFAKKDFLTVDPNDSQFENVTAMLLDPSCSGTGIVGRDDEPKMHLPELPAASNGQSKSKKRKREKTEQTREMAVPSEAVENEVAYSDESLEERLRTLSAFQLQLVERAMQFPAATRITYSTCSIHAEENELVVLKALASEAAKQGGWRIIKREEQPEGLCKWSIRGVREVCARDVELLAGISADEIADASIRCDKGTEDGTMGFFVVAFTRDLGRTAVELATVDLMVAGHHSDAEDEWTGFSDQD
jgi:putative methyltransferase